MSWEGLSRTWMAVTSSRAAVTPAPAWPCVQGVPGDLGANKVSAGVPETCLGLYWVPDLQQMWWTCLTPLPSPGILPRKCRCNDAGQHEPRIQAHVGTEAGSQWIPGLWASSMHSTRSHQHLLPRRRPEPGMSATPCPRVSTLLWGRLASQGSRSGTGVNIKSQTSVGGSLGKQRWYSMHLIQILIHGKC